MGLHALISSALIANTTGGNAEAGSVYRAQRHTFPLLPDLVREAGSSWWQARLGALLCPQLPASCLCCTAGPAAHWASGDRQADYGNKQSVFAFITWRRGSVLLNTELQRANRLLRVHQQSMLNCVVNWTLCVPTQSCFTQILTASPSASLPLSLRLNIQTV